MFMSKVVNVCARFSPSATFTSVSIFKDEIAIFIKEYTTGAFWVIEREKSQNYYICSVCSMCKMLLGNKFDQILWKLMEVLCRETLVGMLRASSKQVQTNWKFCRWNHLSFKYRASMLMITYRNTSLYNRITTLKWFRSGTTS